MTPALSKPVDSSSVEEQILAVVRDLLLELGSARAAESLTMESLLDRDLGLGSLERVELLMRLEARFKTRLPEEVAQESETPSDWARAIFDGATPRSGRERYRIVQPEREAPAPPASELNWPGVLRYHAQLDPARVQIHLLEEDSGQDITCGQLLSMASRVAAGLIGGGLRPDETVAIMLPTCADFFYAFFGVMLAGGIAVPIYPPARADKIEEYVRRQVLILKNAEVRFLISFDRVRAVSQIMRLSIPSLLEVTSVESLSRSGASLPARGVNPAETAFIQYTSGSTGDPKGVVLSHANVLANVRGIGWSVGFRPDDVVVSWLPLYHDMGLIGAWLFSVYHGAPITLMSPLAFLSRPERWMWAMHDSGGTLCPAPNFSYELCARKIPDESIRGLDLSRWRVAINAGEAVLPGTLERFAARFKPYGFRETSFVPCYGLAESSVALTFTPMNRLPVIDVIRRDVFESEGRALPAVDSETNVLRFVANGRPMPGHELKLLDEEGREAGERVQARIFFRGPSSTSGYYRNAKVTAAIRTQDGWMDSGDLGYRADGEVYVTGRLKDCIIKSGRNIIPQEIEAAAAEVPGVRKGCVAAFGALDSATGTERLVVVAETRATSAAEMKRIEDGIVKSVDAVLGIPPDKVALVGPQSIPKTSSGKIRRNATRTLYLDGRLSARRRAPWVQIARLWLENLGNGIRLWRRTIWARASRWWRATCMDGAGYAGGVAARLAPSVSARTRLIRFTARGLLRLSGQYFDALATPPAAAVRPSVLIANRAGHLDPLAAAALLPNDVRFADAALIRELPRAAAFLLSPLELPAVSGARAPQGGTAQARLARALADGSCVLVFADGPVGAPPERSRFRMDAFRAAAETGAAVYPLLFTGTEGIVWPGANADLRWLSSEIGMTGRRDAGGRPAVIRGVELRLGSSELPELIRFRDTVRGALTGLEDQRAADSLSAAISRQEFS